MSPAQVKALRGALELTQQNFASLLGLSFVSVNKWENSASAPTGLSEVMLELLRSALRSKSSRQILEGLRACNGNPLDVVRTLARMER
jgi:putative transcriptional regulator